jgi:hypothetical protein
MQKRVMAKRTQLGPRSHPEYDTHGGALVEKKKEKWGKRKKKSVRKRAGKSRRSIKIVSAKPAGQPRSPELGYPAGPGFASLTAVVALSA